MENQGFLNRGSSRSPPSMSTSFSSAESPENFRTLNVVQRGRPITGRHHFTSSENVRRFLFMEEQIRIESTPPSCRPPIPFMQNLPNQVGVPPRFRHHQQVSSSGARMPNHGATIPILPGRECKFCKNNGESKDQYTSHVLRNPANGKLICPVLRSHTCDICRATGDDAHTRNYCPKLKQEKKLKYAVPVTLKNTKRQSDGQIRNEGSRK